MQQQRFCLFAKRDIFSQHAGSIAQALFGDKLQAFHGSVGDALPDIGPDPVLLVSFLSPWIVPQSLLDRCGTAINFHPGSVDYPGTGCYNFALYEEAAEFGTVCHHMLAKVDTGPIIEERRFQVFGSDSVESLKLRTMATMLSLFHDVMCLIAAGRPLPTASTHWTRNPFTRRGMEALKEVQDSTPEAEAARRVRATTYPGYPGPFLVSGGQTIYYPVPDRPPLA